MNGWSHGWTWVKKLEDGWMDGVMFGVTCLLEPFPDTRSLASVSLWVLLQETMLHTFRIMAFDILLD